MPNKISNSTSWVENKGHGSEICHDTYAIPPLVQRISDFECSKNVQTLLLANVLYTQDIFRRDIIHGDVPLGSRQMASCYFLLYCTEYSEVFKVYTNQDVFHI